MRAERYVVTHEGARLRISARAVSRFWALWPEKKLGLEARDLLGELVAQARPIKPLGDGVVWRVPGHGDKPGQRWRFVVADETVVDVLPPFDDWRRGTGG